jgi:ABC-type Fe3+-hydroxamate transport system substrate-binding protein
MENPASKLALLGIMAATMAARQASKYAIETIEGIAKREAAKKGRMQERIEAMKAEYELIQKKQSKLSANKRAYIVHWYERHYGKIETPESK